jgi:hypothetical protein
MIMSRFTVVKISGIGITRDRDHADSWFACQRREARKRLAAGESARSIAKDFRVHHMTVLGAC